MGLVRKDINLKLEYYSTLQNILVPTFVIVRELSKCMDSATLGSYNKLLRVIKFVIDTEFRFKSSTQTWQGSQMKPKFFVTVLGQVILKQE
jgi:hypothetical protein